MAWPVVDLFNDIAGTLLSDHTSDSGDSWTARVRNLVITSANRVMSNNSSSACECTVDVTPPSADYEVYGNIHFLTATVGRIGLWARRLAGEATGYMLRYNAGNWQLLRWDDGTAVVLDEVAASVVIDTDYEMKIRVEGSTITGYVDGVEVVSATDSTYTAAGLVGVYSHGNGAAPTETTRAHLSDFGARNIPSGGEQIDAAFISSGSQTFAATVTPGEATVDAAFIASAAQTFTANVTTGSVVSAAFLASAAQTFTATITPGTAPLSAAFIASGAQLFAADVGAVTFLEVSTGKMLNARFSTSAYTNEWLYVSTDGSTFVPTYNDSRWGNVAKGKLINQRSVQAAFAIEDEEDYPEPFDPQDNTDAFIASLPTLVAHGVLGVTIGLQGGNPNIGNNGSSYDIGAFNPDGSLRMGSGTYTAPEPGSWMYRIKQILEATAAQGMITILNLFYHGQDQRLTDNDAVRAACDNVVDFLVANNFRHVIFDIANEYDIGGSNPLGWQRSVLSNNGSGSINGDSDEIAGLIIRIQERYTVTHGLSWRAPVGTSQAARPNERFKDNLKLYADIALPHGNVLDDWEDEEEDTYAHMVAMRSSIDSGPNPGIPIVMNEDDNKRSSDHGYVNDTNLGEEIHALTDCLAADVSWGYMIDFYHQKYGMGLDTGWWDWAEGTAGVVQASRTEADYFSDVLDAVLAALESSALAGAFIASGSQVFAATITAGSVTVEGAFISSGSQTFAATVTSSVTVDAAFIESGSELYAADVTGDADRVEAAFIASGSQVFAATITPGSVTVSGAFISAGSELFAAIVTSGTVLGAAFIESGSQTFEATITPGSVTVEAAFVSSGSQVFPAGVTATATVGAAFIASGSVLYPADVENSLLVPGAFIASGAALYPATITTGAVTLSAAFIASGSELFLASVGFPVTEPGYGAFSVSLAGRGTFAVRRGGRGAFVVSRRN